MCDEVHCFVSTFTPSARDVCVSVITYMKHLYCCQTVVLYKSVLTLVATGTIVILSKLTLLVVKGTLADRHTIGVLTKKAPLIFWGPN